MKSFINNPGSHEDVWGDQISAELRVTKEWDIQYRMEVPRRDRMGGGLESASAKEGAGVPGRGTVAEAWH